MVTLATEPGTLQSPQTTNNVQVKCIYIYIYINRYTYDNIYI